MHWKEYIKLKKKNRKSDNDDVISINIGLRSVFLERKLNKAIIKLHQK